MVLLYTRLFRPLRSKPETAEPTTTETPKVPLDEELPERCSTEYQKSTQAVRQAYHLERRMFP